MIRDKVLLSRLAFPHPFVFQACSFNRENLWCPDRRFTACLLREVKPYRPRIAHVDRVGGATDDEQQSAWTLVVRVERLPIRGSDSNAAVPKTGAWRRPIRAPDPRRPCAIDVATGQRSGHQPMRARWCRPVICRDACRRKNRCLPISAPDVWSAPFQAWFWDLAETISGTILGTIAFA